MGATTVGEAEAVAVGAPCGLEGADVRRGGWPLAGAPEEIHHLHDPPSKEAQEWNIGGRNPPA